MTTFAHGQDRADLVEPDIKPGVHPVGPTSPEAAWKRVQEILDGHGAAVDLVGLVQQLDDASRETLKGELAKVAAVATGDVTLEVGDLVGATAGDALTAAVTSRVHPTPSRLQRSLSRLEASALADIKPAIMVEIAKPFRSQTFLLVLPKIGGDVSSLTKHPELLRWFVESTSPNIAAELMGAGGTEELGATLDRLKLWRPWIEHVTQALPTYEQLANGSKDTEVKRLLVAPFGQRASTDAAGKVTIAPTTYDGFAAIDEAIATGASRVRLLDAINTASGFYVDQEPSVIAALHRVGATADDVLGVALAYASQPATAWLPLLLSAAGVSAQHVKTFVGRFQIQLGTLDEPTLRLLHTKGGASLRISDLSFVRDDAAHRRVVESELLREWFLEDAQPVDLLWFCAAQGELVSRATRIIVARHPDWKWVRQLTGTESVVQLRALALACNDPPTAKFIRDELLRDPKGIASFGHGEISPKSYEGERDRLRFAIALHDPDAAMARLADLGDAERVAFGKDPSAVADLVHDAKLDEFQFLRAADLIDLDFRQSVLLCPPGREIINHLRTRPPAEEALALADAKLVARAAADICADLFVVFPSLASRLVLAKALSDNDSLLQLLLAGSDPSRVLDLVAVDPALTPALGIFAEDASLVRLLPPREHMTSGARALVDRLARTPHLDADVSDAVDHVRTDETVEDRLNASDSDEKVAVERAVTIHDVGQTESLTDAIDKLIASKANDPATLLAALSSHRDQVPALLDDSAQWSRVGFLADHLRVSPAVACPFITPELLVQMANALRWYFGLPGGTALLHLITSADIAGHVAQYLGADTPMARSWLESLPRGATLVDRERRSLDLLERSTSNRDVIADLFRVRFNVEPPEAADATGKKMSTSSAGDLDSLYRIVSRLPNAHLDQERITAFLSHQLSVPGADGLWNPMRRTVEIGEDEHEGKGQNEFHSDKLDEQVDGDPAEGERAPHPDRMWLTADQVKRAFGYDDAGIKARVDSKELLVNTIAGTTYYKVKPTPIDDFTQIVLHEIGHSIDEILGSHTKPVYEFAGWHEFNDDQFDAWAGEMGGWDKVSAADKPKIKQAWIDAARAHTGVHDLVPEEHPAMAERYADVGIVSAGREKRSFSAWYPTYLNGRVFVAGSYIGRWYSVDAAIVPSAPSYYSLYAPQEYFAESYVEYYRNVDGSPGSEKKKGGMLASPVKKFFDEKVDALKYDPRRFEKHDDDS